MDAQSAASDHFDFLKEEDVGLVPLCSDVSVVPFECLPDSDVLGGDFCELQPAID